MYQKKKFCRLPIIITFFSFLAILVYSLGCSSIPHIRQSSKQETSRILEDCRKIFPSGEWQFVHTIQVNLAGEKRTKLMGITQVDSESRRLHCVLMTIEGMVVFEAKYENKKTIVMRSTPPFDSPHFAKGLIQNVKFIFLSPQNNCIKSGLASNNEYVCRYRMNSSHIKDIYISKEKKIWSVHLYNNGQRVRTLHATFAHSIQALPQPAHPQRLYLESYKSNNDYSLTMELIKAKKINTH